jgi:LysM repeat protein
MEPVGAAPDTTASAPSAARTAVRAAGIPLLAAAVVGGSATGAAAVGAPAAAGVPQAGSHTATSGAVAGTAQSRATVRAAAPATAAPKGVTYVVKAGDTLSEIAHRAGIRLAALLAANDLTATETIFPGQRLVLPGVKAPTTAPKPRAKPVVHVVVAGDTLSEIAHRYKITVASIMKANRLTSTVIRPGQKLVLPGAVARRAPAPAASTHVVVVKAGDTLSGIAHREGTTLARLLALNHLTASSVIHPGQRLLVPGYPNTFAGRTYPDSVARAAAANRALLAGRAVPSRARMQALVVATARRFTVDPALAQAIAYQESGFNMRAVSPANAIGCMQVIPSSGVWASRLVGRRLDLLDPEDNVTAGVAIIAALRRAAPDERTAIAGYYQGLGSVTRNGMFPDTRRYVANVQRLEARFR